MISAYLNYRFLQDSKSQTHWKASTVVCILPPCSKTSGVEQVRIGFEVEKEAALAEKDLQVEQVPAAVSEGATLTALEEDPGGDKKVWTVMFVQRNNAVYASDSNSH